MANPTRARSGKPPIQPRGRTYVRSEDLPSALERIRQAARRNKQLRFTVLRQTMRKRLRAKLAELKAELRRRMHDPVPEVGKWLRSVVTGHLRYYGVPMNSPALGLFRYQVVWHWYRALCRRSQKGRIPWERMQRLIARYLPPVRLYHPYPLRRLGVIP